MTRRQSKCSRKFYLFAARAGIIGNIAPPVLAQPADYVAEQGYRGLMRGQRVVIPGLANKIAAFMARLVPHAILLAAVDNRQSRRRSARDT